MERQESAVTLDVVLGFIGSAHFPAEVLVVGLHLADAGAVARRVVGACDGRKLDLVQVLVPVCPNVPRGAELPGETGKAAVTPAVPYKSCLHLASAAPWLGVNL